MTKDKDPPPTAQNANPYGFDEKGRPWVRGEIEDRNRMANLVLLILAVIVVGLAAGGAFVYLQWARAGAPDTVWTTPKSAR